MKVELDLPDWVDERRIIILAGTELVAQKDPDKSYWEVKEERCSHCGQCCMEFTPNSDETPSGIDDEGKCKALYLEGSDLWMCGARFQRPYVCLFDPLKANTPECSITKKRVDVDV